MKIFTKRLPEITPWKAGLLQSLGIFAYIIGVSTFMSRMATLFQQKMAEEIAMGIIMLSILSVSTLICAVLAGGIPAYLFLEKKIKEAVLVVVWMVVFLIGFIGITAGIMWQISVDRPHDNTMVENS